MATTTLISHESKSGGGPKGPWTLNIFKGQDGYSYKTFEADISSQAFGLMGQPVNIEFEQRPSKNPQFPADLFITSIAATGSVTPPNAIPPSSPTPESPEANQKLRTAPVVPAVDDRQIMIMRQSGLDRALTAFGIAGVDPLTKLSELYELSDQFIDYFINGITAPSVVSEGPTV